MSLINIGGGVRIPEKHICYSAGTLIIEQNNTSIYIKSNYKQKSSLLQREGEVG